MQPTVLSPYQSLDKSYRLQNISRPQIDAFKAGYEKLFSRLDEKESEENAKGHLMDFLKEVFYSPAHLVATKGRTDFVIYTGREATTPAGVLFEVKRPANKAEMVTRENLNCKAMHELILYYFRERIQSKNSDIRHCVITNVYEWFIFDAAVFERLFYQNKTLVREFNAWAAGQKVSTNNDLFYNEIAKPFLAALTDEIPFTYVDLRDYSKVVSNASKDDDKRLLALYKLLSPTHLLKLPAATDSNTLNPRFYGELLHLIGLEEVKDGGKKLIRRKPKGNRDAGSLLENTINTLDAEDILSRLPDAASYGKTREEQYFNIGLELCIIWINRVLFLKLLESQLLKYHDKDLAYSFLNPDRIRDFDDLNKLFFQVLARKGSDRSESIQKLFGKVPYLNSSLFEISDIERDTIRINSLDNRLELPLLKNSVLRESVAFRTENEANTLRYLFLFLDAYDFSSESREAIDERGRSLINASVLGLIFEKINGYRDGSFYTPGFITEYMCRETIRKAVLQKFNAAKGWECADFTSLYNKISDAREANELINSLRICDPAVGSGHFLVSALNELIALKSDLGILVDESGKRLREYSVSVVNDELVVLDEDGAPFEYAVQPSGKVRPDLQRVQKTLFHEKQTLIENCLFGVDINPNSVKICRLRLWIELLKSAYYTEESGYTELETLPNIDINIKQGNSLLSKFSLTEDLSEVFKKQKFSLRSYKDAVKAYKEAKSKETKAELQRFIYDIKKQFRETVQNRDPRRKKLSQLRGQRVLLDNNVDMFGNPIMDPKLVAIEKKRLDKLIEGVETEIAAIENNALYQGSFEWRFEFPEILDEKGNFVGFDAVIGNPPYIRQEELGESKKLLKPAFPHTYAGTADLYVMFIEHGLNLLCKGGQFTYIIPNKWMRAGYGLNLRKWLKSWAVEQIADFGDLPVFDEATTYPSILSLRKTPSTGTLQAVEVDRLKYDTDLADYIRARAYAVATDTLADDGWLLSKGGVQALMQKLRRAGKPLGDYVKGKIYYGIKTGLNEAFVIDTATRDRLIAEDPRSAEVIKPFLAGRDVKRYQTPKIDKYLILFENGSTRAAFGKLDEAAAWNRLQERYPAVCAQLEPFGLKAKVRADKGEYWWELRACAYYDEFKVNKIIFPDIGNRVQAMYDNIGTFCVNTAYFIPKDDKYLLALLNSTTVLNFYINLSTAIRGGYLRFFRQYVEQIPVPVPIQAVREQIESLVDQILASKATAPTADTSALEAEIDRLVYGLYGLTEEEVALVEGRMVTTPDSVGA